MATLTIAAVVPRTEAEGPGVRFALWVQGCALRCPGCCNPEFLTFAGGNQVDVGAMVADALAAGVEGVSLLGGEPFTQAEALAVFAAGVRREGLSVMVYTGYTLAELRSDDAPAGAAALLAETDLLVDGRYDHTRRTTVRRWVGSDNQVVHFLTDRYAPDDPRFAESNTLELRYGPGPDGALTVTVNGFPVNGARTRL